ncbi:hypothetical protein K458DRAFT_137342 [Lentithecium fluviatile CBS 122367]|uniref:DUF7719 domain-containing protein n=1 Tax=Lentithecium fluviatile CBS 122367 TaxID=1168545 RepID=A0A6G1IKS5_9PLEO|nr:hypothetical protein K458DRAFT_137342 [Lentithecium fluviatile CBS 122367]
MGGNRKERRAAGQKGSSGDTRGVFQPTTDIDEDGVNYILKHPDYSGPKGKTLFELAEERQKELNKGKPGFAADPEDPVGPFGDAILYSISMAMLHFTLDVVVYNQYREAIVWNEIFKRAASAFPIFLTLVYLTHVEFSTRYPLIRNLLFMAGGIATGCYLVYSANEHGYFYVMKAAPPVASLGIWSVVEMDVLYAAANAAIVFGYGWWNGYAFF